MPGTIDESRPFIPVRIAVLTVSDTRGPADDRSGDALAGRLERDGHILAGRAIVRDEIDAIRAALRAGSTIPVSTARLRPAARGLPGATSRPKPSRASMRSGSTGSASCSAG